MNCVASVGYGFEAPLHYLEKSGIYAQVISVSVYIYYDLEFAQDYMNLNNVSIFEAFTFCRYSFALRIVLLLVMAWMTLLIFNAGIIVIPISLGRLVFEAVPRLPITHGIKCNGNLLIFVQHTLHCYIIFQIYEVNPVTLD